METKEANTDSVKAKNRVLTEEYKQSSNFYESDLMLQHLLTKKMGRESWKAIKDKLIYIGEMAAQEMDSLSLKADKSPPVLQKRDAWGEDINHIDFHPSYWKLVEIAAKSGMFQVKWEPKFREQFADDLNKMSFAISALYAMAETGVYCPLCMTDGVAVLIDKFCEEEDKERLLKSICAQDLASMKTGAMYLTEKAGGSDVGANCVTATHKEGRYYLLNGEKWFCSNANGEIAFVLARTDSEKPGTRGLSIFLVEKTLSDGSPNPMNIVRLKDKLGVKSMASAEIILTDTVGKLIGKEFEGFRIMTEMINLSRVYNSVAALSASKRALVEAYQFLNGRFTFGKNALEHPLVRKKLEELGALNAANFYLVWRAIEALDNAKNNEQEKELLRLLTPLCKKWSAENGVYITRESMELMGGIGYIEDQVMPKLMRDIMVLPIWEGAGNIMTLDMIRASMKSKGLEVILTEIKASFHHEEYGAALLNEVNELQSFLQKLMQLSHEALQANAPQFFSRLTTAYQLHLLITNTDETSGKWTQPSLKYLSGQLWGEKLKVEETLSVEEVRSLVAWGLE